MKTLFPRFDIRVAFLYALFGGLWILLSDRLLSVLVSDNEQLTRLQTLKGWGFVAFSALLIFLLLRRELGIIRRAGEEIQRLNAELEERVRQRTAELQLTNEDLQTFIYSLSHDLKAPLRAIQGFADILHREERSSLSSDGQRYLDHICNAAQRMELMIEALLSYTRLGRASGRYPVALKDVFDQVAGDLKDIVEECQGSLHIPAQLPSVWGEPTLLRQIFANLLQNALLYRRPGVPPTVWVEACQQGKQITVSIKDNGIGIPQEFHEKVFNPFQRLHSEKDYPGTGIGLAIVKKAVQLLDGKVWLESTPGEGSTFYVQLPAVIQDGEG